MRRCSYCYKTGHNRRTCPDLKLYIEKNPDSYYARQAERKKEASKPSNRRCGFCGTVGHTKRTCGDRLDGIRKVTRKNRRFRRKLRTALARGGWVPGALIQFTPREQIPGSVSGYDIDSANRYFDYQFKENGNTAVAMVIGYHENAFNFNYFGGQNVETFGGSYLTTKPAIKIMTPNGLKIAIPLPEDVEQYIEGKVQDYPKGGMSYRRPWSFSQCNVVGKSTIKAPKRFLFDHFGERFWNGEAGAADMVDNLDESVWGA